MAVKAYVGGHLVEYDGSGVKVNGNGVTFRGGKDHVHKKGRDEIFR